METLNKEMEDKMSNVRCVGGIWFTQKKKERKPRFNHVEHRKETTLLLWERAVRYFRAFGFVITKEGKYITMEKDGKKVFIGKAGAIRTGKNQTESFSITPQTLASIAYWEKNGMVKEGK